MHFGHAAIYVKDLEKMKAFYEKYFGCEEDIYYHNPKTGLKLYFLTFPSGRARLELMSRPELNEVDKSKLSFGYTHIAINTGSKELVDSLTARLKEDGCTVLSGPRTTGDGCYESSVLDPECNNIEIVA
ncbi:lactoylglutathione lyase [Parelusimicrobium proximum]|uniref:VOC family protein n=1 Tax=Parelusimicrobium proximum TaxID=3228953 RepID=UPI003D17C8CD